MPTINEHIFELTTSHSVYLERYKAGLVKQMTDVLDASEADLEDILARRLERIAELGFDTGPVVTERIAELVERIAVIRGEAYAILKDTLQGELEKLAQYESVWQATMLEEAITFELSVAPPTAEVLNAAVFSRPFQGQVFEEWVDGMAAADISRMNQAITLGVVEGETATQIRNRILGSRDLNYTDGVTAASRRGAEAVARTATNHVVTQAREEVYAANSDIIQKIRWCSTLDGRTTLICIDRDGKLYDIHEGPRPPAHWNCRSTTMPVIDGMNLVGNRPAITDTRNRRQREIDFRADAKAKAGSDWKKMSAKERNEAVKRQKEKWVKENVGQVPKSMTYSEWLKKQSASFQDELLGPTRGQLFRDGGLSVDRFVDQSGHKYTLDELRAREASAFKKAKL